MLKSKNQATLLVNYSYNSFHDLCSSKNIYEGYVPKYGIFDFTWELLVNNCTGVGYNSYIVEWSKHFCQSSEIHQHH